MHYTWYPAFVNKEAEVERGQSQAKKWQSQILNSEGLGTPPCSQCSPTANQA